MHIYCINVEWFSSPVSINHVWILCASMLWTTSYRPRISILMNTVTTSAPELMTEKSAVSGHWMKLSFGKGLYGITGLTSFSLWRWAHHWRGTGRSSCSWKPSWKCWDHQCMQPAHHSFLASEMTTLTGKAKNIHEV